MNFLLTLVKSKSNSQLPIGTILFITTSVNRALADLLHHLAVRNEDQKVKGLRGKEIALVKVICVGTTGESATWKSESRMRE